MSGTRKVFHIAAILLVVCLIGGTAIFLHYLSTPATATPTQVPTSKTAVPSFDLQPVHVQGKYASFTYPKALQAEHATQTSNQELALYSYDYRDIEWWQLTITIHSLTGPNLENDSGYNLRKNNPSTYQESTMAVNGQQIIVMTDTQDVGFSKAAFLLHDDMSADISLTGDSANSTADLAATFAQVIHSWQWKS